MLDLPAVTGLSRPVVFRRFCQEILNER